MIACSDASPVTRSLKPRHRVDRGRPYRCAGSRECCGYPPTDGRGFALQQRADDIGQGAAAPCPADALTTGEAAADFCAQLIDNGGAASVHSPAIAELPGGDIGVWWYGGSREGAKDVAIWFSRYDRLTGEFSPAEIAVTRAQLSSQLGRYIKKLGNPAAMLDGGGRLWLFFVSVSVGGWAGSAVNAVYSDDGGVTWSEAKRLVTSPFFNVSTLVRGAPVALNSGDIMMPVYHEFIGNLSEALILDTNGTVKDKLRITWGLNASQPSIAPLSASEAAVVMRSKSANAPFVHFASTTDGGKSFQANGVMDLPSADNSVFAVRLSEDQFWIVYNSDRNGRRALSIAVASADGSGAEKIADLENALDSPQRREFSYPAVVTDGRGIHHVVWTHDRQHIKHAAFTDSWLLARLRSVSTRH